MITMRAASYERVSSDEQAKEGFSLEAQNEKNINYIKSQDWEFTGSYIDPGKSGKNLNRPEMKRLLSDIERGKINVVVVHKLDRLTRNIGDLHYLLTLYDKKDIKLVSISENIDTSTAMGRMFVYMLGIFAQWYRENLSEEVIKGQATRAKTGLRNTYKPPYGYTASREDMSLTVDKEEAEIVRKIFEWFIGGWGYRRIARELNDSGVLTKSNGPFYAQTILKIVHNPTYFGATHWKPKDEPEENRTIVRDMHEAIITEEMFNEAQNTSKRRSGSTMSTSIYDFPFSTIVKCGECGRSYIGFYKNKRTGLRYYRCSGKNDQPTPCKSSSQLSEKALAEMFLDFLDKFKVATPQVDESLNPKDAERDRKKLIRLIDESAAKKKNYTRAMGAGKIDYDTFAELIDEENAKSLNWQEELERLEVHRPAARTLKDIALVIKELRSNWSSMDFEQQKATVQKLFEAIVIKKTGDDWRIVSYVIAE